MSPPLPSEQTLGGRTEATQENFQIIISDGSTSCLRRCQLPHPDCTELGAVGLQRPRWYSEAVREIGVLRAGAKQEEADDDVEGKHGDRQVPTVQHGGKTTE